MSGRNVIAFWRMLGEYQAVTVVNNNAEEQALKIPVWQLGVTDEISLARIMLTTEEGYNVGALSHPVRHGFLKLNMPPRSAALFVSHAEDFTPVVASVKAPVGEE